MNQKTTAIILAAGKGTRMKSSMPKVMHRIGGLSMINHVVNACGDMAVTVVIADGMDDVADAVTPHQTVIQKNQLGTADAVCAAKNALVNFDGYIFILYGDCPFIKQKTLIDLHATTQKTGLAVLGFETKNPHGYGRLIVNNDSVTEIIEEKDCEDFQRAITLCNSGIYCIQSRHLWDLLDKITNDNVQGEFYLTDIVEIARKKNIKTAFMVTNEDEVMGINSRAQLAQAESIFQKNLRARAMDFGVTLIDPDTVYLSADTSFGSDIVIEPNVCIGTGVRIGSHTRIHAFSHIEGAEIGEHAEVGPFARIRPKSKIGNHVTVGNFIEVNRSEFKDGAKSKHLSYIGDAIIGEKANIGAGTVFANYDGYNKHVSTTGKNVFVGSNATIVSPVNIGDNAMVAAGSTITKDIADGDLGVARAKSLNVKGWADKYHAKNKQDMK